MRVAIFGGGSIGSRHAANARALGHDVTVIDQLLTRGVHPSLFRASACDAVMICTPAVTHRAVAWMILDAGFEGPCFVEKPIDVSSDVEIFTRWPHPVQMVGYNWRFHPDLAPLRSLDLTGRSIHFDCRTDMATWPGRQYADPWLECSHEVDLARALKGDPRHVHAGQFVQGGWLHLVCPDADVLIDLRWRAPEPSRLVHVHPHRRAERLVIQPSLGAALDESYRLELAHFFACVEEGRTPACTFADGLAVVAIMEQARRSAAA